MISKTAMLLLVKTLQWQELRKGLEENPKLIDVRDKRGRNWLHLACGVDIKEKAATSRDSIKVAEVLLSKGLNINEPAFTEDNFRATALWYSIAFGKNLDLARFLLTRGSDPNHCLFAAAYNNDTAAIKLLAENGAEIDPEVEDATPFLFAVQWSRFEAAEQLLRLGANVDYQNSKKMTALHYMLKKGTDRKYLQLLLEHGARGDIENKDGQTAAAIMLKKRDSAYRIMAASLLKARQKPV